MRLSTLAVLLVPLLFAACGGSDPEPAATPAASAAVAETTTPTATPAASGPDCATVGDLDGEAETTPPTDVEVLPYAHLYKSDVTPGGATRFYTVLDGTPDELPSRRDDAQNQLIQNWSYESLDADQDADGAWGKLRGEHHRVDIRVTALCAGKLQIRYTVR